MKMNNTEYAYKEMEKSIALEEETIKQKQNMSKKYSQTLAAMWTRLAWAVMLTISTAASARMATWAATITELPITVACLRLA